MAKHKSLTGKTRALKIAGKEYTIRVGMLAYDAMFQLSGISLLMGWDEERKWDAREYACFLYAALLQHQPEFELDHSYELWDAILEEGRVGEVVDTLFDAYKAGVPKKSEDEENPTMPVAK